MNRKFDAAHAAKLDDRGRLSTMDPERMWDSLGRPTPVCIVDIGAGTGLFAAEFLRLAPAAIVYAADMEPVMLDYLRAHRSEVAAGRLIPVLSTANKVPLDDGIADLAVMINMHHEIDDPPAMYREALRLLHGGGQLLVVDWKPIKTPKGPPVGIRSSAKDAAAIIEASGFSDVTIHDTLPEHWQISAVRK